MIEQVEIVQENITELKVDAIVNAANRALSGGGGVDGAIHRAAGPELLKACRELGPCDTGQAVITPGFKLKARFVIHAVGPVWYGGHKDEADLLASCYRVSFELAKAHRVKSIAFPAISTGAYRYPLDKAVAIALGIIEDWMERDYSFERVVLACYDRKTYSAYHKSWSSRHGNQ